MKPPGKKNSSEKIKPDTDAGKHQGFSDAKQKEILDRINELAGPLCAVQGMELICVEFVREPRGRILRLYIDKPGGVMLDDCVHISRQMGDLLDAGIEEIGPYHLEVSSPGPQRPLGKVSDFEKYRGSKIKVTTSLPVEGKRKFQAVLDGISEGKVLLQVNGKTVMVPYQEIVRARLVHPYGEKGC